jgi:hypothetical protein
MPRRSPSPAPLPRPRQAAATGRRLARSTAARSTAARSAAVLLLAVAVLAGCDEAGAPAPGTEEAAALAATLADLDGVADARAVGSAPTTGDEDRARAAVHLEVDVRTAAADVAEFGAVATAVAAELPATRRVDARIWQEERPGAPALAVEITNAGDRGARTVGLAAEVAAVPGVTGLQVGDDAVSASVADAASFPALAAAVRSARVPTALLTAADARVSTSVAPRLLDPRLADLVARVDRWPGVTSQFVESQGTDEAWLRVQVEGDDTVEELTAALTGAAWPPDGPVVHAVVSSSFRSSAGVVGRREPAAPDPAAADGSPTGGAVSPWPDDPGAPASARADLDITLGGYDAALGHRYLLLTATNASAAPCAVQGRPDITFVRASGTPVPDVETGTPTGTPDPVRYVVPPGAALHAPLSWRAMSTALDPDVSEVLRVTAVPGADPDEVPVDRGGLDVLAGAAVEIGAWEPAPADWTTDGTG